MSTSSKKKEKVCALTQAIYTLALWRFRHWELISFQVLHFWIAIENRMTKANCLCVNIATLSVWNAHNNFWEHISLMAHSHSQRNRINPAHTRYTVARNNDKKSVHLNSIKEISRCLILSNCLHELRISKRDNDWKCKYANNNKTQRELANMKTDKKSPTSSIFLLKANYMWWRFVVTILSKSRFVFLWTSRFRKNQKNKAKRCAWTKSL